MNKKLLIGAGVFILLVLIGVLRPDEESKAESSTKALTEPSTIYHELLPDGRTRLTSLEEMYGTRAQILVTPNKTVTVRLTNGRFKSFDAQKSMPVYIDDAPPVTYPYIGGEEFLSIISPEPFIEALSTADTIIIGLDLSIGRRAAYRFALK